MSSLLALWLPILVSALAVFMISSLVHMVFKWHASNYKGFAQEDAVRDVLRAGNPELGKNYIVPYCADMKDMATEAMKKKYAEGPNAVIVFGPTGQPNMGKYLGLWFVMCVGVAAVAAFLTAKAYGLGAPAQGAAKMAGAITFMAYGMGSISESIWMYRSWKSTATYLLDATLYALGTWAVFLWLWP